MIHIRGYLNLEVAKQLLVTIKSRFIANDGAWMVSMTINIFLIRNDVPKLWGRPDSNRRTPAPEAGIIPC